MESQVTPSSAAGKTSWEDFFNARGWIANNKIHVPQESILELKFADGTELLVLPHSNDEGAPGIDHGVLSFRNGTDVFFYPWASLASVIMKPNPRRSNARTIEREYVERRLVNSDDLILPGQEPVRPPEPEPEEEPATPPHAQARTYGIGDPLGRGTSLY